jgi:hypothetical protein
VEDEEMIIQDLTWKCWKSVEYGAFRQTFKYQSYGFATKFRQSNTYVCRKRTYLQPSDSIHHHDNAPANEVLSDNQLLAQKLITEMECPLYSPDLAPNDLSVPKNKVCLKGMKISGYWRHPKKCDNSNESHSTTGVPNMFWTVAASSG